jgi:hypothetical protein
MKSLSTKIFIALVTVITVFAFTTTTSAKNQWIINSKAYDVDTLIYPHPVGPGVTFAKYDVPAFPLKVSVMTMDLKNPYIDFETCKSGDRGVCEENPLSMAERNTRPGHEVVGATNGDFYFYTNTLENGIPRSGQFRNDECVTNPVGRACFVLDDNRKPYIDHVDFIGRITHNGTTYRLHTINMQRLEWEDTQGNQTNLYTNSYGPATENCSGGMKALIHPKAGSFKWYANSIESCIVDSVFDGAGVTKIPTGSAILWAQGSDVNYLKRMNPGDSLSIRIKVDLRTQPGHIKNFNELMGGSDNIIMKNGVTVDPWDERHPRTCIGFSADSTKVFFVVVDGRSVASAGVTLAEAAGIFIGLGASNAVNLDGGGSSCMVVNDDVVNTPSDGTLRSVGNGCLLIAEAPVDDNIGMLHFSPRSYNVSISALLHPAVWGYNKYGVLKTKDLQGCTYSCDASVGSFKGDIFTASSTPSDGYIYAEYNGVKTSQLIHVVNAQKFLRSDSVVIDKNHPYTIQVLGVSGITNDQVDPTSINWTSNDNNVCTVDGEGVVKAVADGSSKIVGSATAFNDTLLVKVENPKAHITNVENTDSLSAASWTIAQSGGKDRTVTALDHGFKIVFTGSAARTSYLRLSKKISFWGIPDTLRLRYRPNGLNITRISLSTRTAVGTSQVITNIDVTDNSKTEYTVDLPTASWCDNTDLQNYPLSLAYINFTMAQPTSGQVFSFEIPGIELVYGKNGDGVNSINIDSRNFNVYPNPVQSGANVTISATTAKKADIFNIEGQLVKVAKIENSTFSTSGLAAGTYIVKVKDGAAVRLLVK